MESWNITLVVGPNEQYLNLSDALDHVPGESYRVLILVCQDLTQDIDSYIPTDRKIQYLKIASSDNSVKTIDFLGCNFFSNGIQLEIDSTIMMKDCFIFGGGQADQGKPVVIPSSKIIINGKVDYVYGGGYAIGRGSISTVLDAMVIINGQSSHLYGGGYAVQFGAVHSGRIHIQINENGVVDKIVNGASSLIGPDCHSIIREIDLNATGKVNGNISLGGYVAYNSSTSVRDEIHITAESAEISGVIYEGIELDEKSTITIKRVTGSISSNQQELLKFSDHKIQIIQLEDTSEPTGTQNDQNENEETDSNQFPTSEERLDFSDSIITDTSTGEQTEDDKTEATSSEVSSEDDNQQLVPDIIKDEEMPNFSNIDESGDSADQPIIGTSSSVENQNNDSTETPDAIPSDEQLSEINPTRDENADSYQSPALEEIPDFSDSIMSDTFTDEQSEDDTTEATPSEVTTEDDSQQQIPEINMDGEISEIYNSSDNDESGDLVDQPIIGTYATEDNQNNDSTETPNVIPSDKQLPAINPTQNEKTDSYQSPATEERPDSSDSIITDTSTDEQAENDTTEATPSEVSSEKDNQQPIPEINMDGEIHNSSDNNESGDLSDQPIIGTSAAEDNQNNDSTENLDAIPSNEQLPAINPTQNDPSKISESPFDEGIDTSPGKALFDKTLEEDNSGEIAEIIPEIIPSTDNHPQTDTETDKLDQENKNNDYFQSEDNHYDDKFQAGYDDSSHEEKAGKRKLLPIISVLCIITFLVICFLLYRQKSNDQSTPIENESEETIINTNIPTLISTVQNICEEGFSTTSEDSIIPTVLSFSAEKHDNSNGSILTSSLTPTETVKPEINLTPTDLLATSTYIPSYFITPVIPSPTFKTISAKAIDTPTTTEEIIIPTETPSKTPVATDIPVIPSATPRPTYTKVVMSETLTAVEITKAPTASATMVLTISPIEASTPQQLDLYGDFLQNTEVIINQEEKTHFASIQVNFDTGTFFYQNPYQSQEYILRWLNNGTEVEILSGPIIRNNAEWYEVFCEQYGQTGWISSTSISIINE